MPVRIPKSDTMLCSQFEHSWCDPPSPYVIMGEDDWDMKFLDIADFDTSDPILNGLNQFDTTNVDFSDVLAAPSSPKHKKMRHHDCMWSGTCVDKSHPTRKRVISSCQVKVTATQNEDTQRTTVDDTITPKFSAGKTIMTPNSVMKNVTCINNNNINNSKIQPGRSLLINNSRVNTNTAPTKNSNSLKLSIDTSRDFDTMISSSLRPDTPLSLGDDVQDFKNNIDLTPCPSSNRMKFSEANSSRIINMYREHLEETSETSTLLNVFNKGQRSTPNDLNDILNDLTFLSDFEDFADDSSNVDVDEELEDYRKPTKTGLMPSSASSSSRTMSHQDFISDHSYTRPKGSLFDLNSLGVQTPSDSEEDNDVVNINEKNLPTNPSARDRRALQTTVAHKIARSKQSNQRRRVSDDDSISSSTSTLSSKGSTPIKIGSQTPQRYVLASRKRRMHDNYKKYHHGHSKKQRMSHSKHQKQSPIDPDEAETIEKRNLHNNMERQRRIGLKNLFEELKCQIPSLKDKERAPKVNILREAATYCSKLRRDEDLHAELVKKNNRLLTRMRNLKASIAAQQRRNY